MAQLTFVDGDVLTASQINTYLMGEGGAWTSWTPTVTQSGSVTVTNTRSRYARYGRTIVATIQLSVTGSGSGNNAIVVSLPVTAAASGQMAGTAILADAGTAIIFPAVCYLTSTTAFQLYATSTDGTSVALGSASSPNTSALASGDGITAQIVYEAAS